jgi:Acetyltransferases, including N-acetylases of ribosomal proteins
MPLRPPSHIALSGLTLRAWSPTDAPRLAATLAASDAHLRAWTPWVIDGREPGLTLEQRLQRHADAFVDGTEWVYGLFDPTTGEVLGGAGLYPRVGPDAVELGYWLSVRHTGRGLATRAAAALTDVALTAPEIRRVEIRCDPRNVPSARVPERLGYQLDEDFAGDNPHGLAIWFLERRRREP